MNKSTQIICALASLAVINVLSLADTLCFEAESAPEVILPFRITVASEEAYKTNKTLIKGASGNSYLEIPEGTGTQKDKDKTGLATFTFQLTEPGDYVLWCRVWWADECGNSVMVSIDGAKPFTLGQDTSYQSWHWIKSEVKIPQLRLEKGQHTLKLLEREDGIAIDQLLITSDRSYVPVGIEELKGELVRSEKSEKK